MPSFFDPSRLEQESIQIALTNVRCYFKGRTLDMGCGSQPYAGIVRANHCSYVGVDISHTHEPPPDVCADSTRLPFKHESFDTVLSTQVLEHIDSPVDMIGEAARVLKRNGFLILTAPQVWPLHEEPNDYFRYTKYALTRLSEKCNLRVVYLAERGGGVMALSQMWGALLYDTIGKSAFGRVMLKLLISPLYLVAKLVDRLFFYPKLTLGYVMVAQKAS